MNLTEANESVSTDGELRRCLFSKALKELKIPSISNSMRKKSNGPLEETFSQFGNNLSVL